MGGFGEGRGRLERGGFGEGLPRRSKLKRRNNSFAPFFRGAGGGDDIVGLAWGFYGLDWIGLDWIGLDWRISVGLDGWVGYV